MWRIISNRPQLHSIRSTSHVCVTVMLNFVCADSKGRERKRSNFIAIIYTIYIR